MKQYRMICFDLHWSLQNIVTRQLILKPRFIPASSLFSCHICFPTSLSLFLSSFISVSLSFDVDSTHRSLPSVLFHWCCCSPLTHTSSSSYDYEAKPLKLYGIQKNFPFLIAGFNILQGGTLVILNKKEWFVFSVLGYLIVSYILISI